MNNIALLNSAGIKNPTETAGIAGGAQGLLGFFNLILGGITETQNGQQIPTQVTEDQSLQEKIAALLQNPPAEQSELLRSIFSVLQPEQSLPENISPDNVLKKIIQTLQTSEIKPAGLQPTLLRDLTAQSAPAIQTAENTAPLPTATPKSIYTHISHMLENAHKAENTPSLNPELAAILNDITPGAGDVSHIPEILALQPSQTEATPFVADPEILAVLKEKVPALLSQTAFNAPEAAPLAQVKDEIIHILKEEGVAPADMHKYMQVLAQDVQTPAPTTPIDMTTEDILLQKHTQQPAASTQTHKQALPLQNEAPQPAPAKPQTALDPAVLQQQHAPEQQVAPQASKSPTPESLVPQQSTQNVKTDTPNTPTTKTSQITHPSFINSLMSEDSGFNNDDMGGQQGKGSLSYQDTQTESIGLKITGGIQTQGFDTYINTLQSTAQPAHVSKMVSMQLRKNAAAKIDTMTLQLEPADMGRLEITMTFDKDGGIKAHLTADKPEALAALKNDAAHLQRTLQEAGFDLDENAISFDLRHDHNENGKSNNAYKDNDQNNTNFIDTTAESNALQAQIALNTYGHISASGVNIMV